MAGHDSDSADSSAERGAGPPPGGEDKARSRPIRPELQNWSVVDVAGADSPARARQPAQSDPADETIEGEAVIVHDEAIVIEEAIASMGGPGSAGAGGAEPGRSEAVASFGEDQVDSILIAGLPERVLTLEPGSPSTLVVSLLNNGAQPAVFDVHLEGWVRDSWLPPGGVHVPVLPGERVAAAIPITPPRHHASTAGEFPFFVVVRSPQHLRRVTRIQGMLVMRPFTEFTVGRLMPASVALSPWRRKALFTVALANMSNHPIALQLKGQGVGLDVDFDFNDDPAQPWQAGPAVVELAAGGGVELFVRVRVRSGPLFSTRPLPAAIRLVGSVMDELRPPRSANAELVYHTLIRPWHLGATVAASALLLIASGVLAIAARMMLDTSPRTASIADAAQPSPAPVVIVLSQSPPESNPSSAAAPQGQAEPSVQNPVTVDGMPIVQANQVTNPGEPLAPRAQPAPVAASSESSQRTYAQMFQEIALQFDLDWRLLAAQAYQESGFDPLALGNDGDMGLMQVLPSTWREWAPQVGANDPFDAYNNTLVAAAYLDYVRALMGQKGKPQAQWMLVAYNWGPDKLGDFLEGGGVWDDLPPERARYATEIMSIARTIP